MREFEAIGEQLKYEDYGYSCRRAEEIIKIQFVGTEIVRCKDCKWYSKGGLFCGYWAGLYEHAETYPQFSPIDFCSRGVRKESEE